MTNNHRQSESGNVVFFILLAIVLIGLVTVALRSGGLEDANVDREQISVAVSKTRQDAAEFERGVVFILTNGVSESDLLFSHPDAPSSYGLIATTPRQQIFAPEGGGAEYRRRPSNISAAGHETDPWEFFGTTALPGVGSDEADLVAVLPYVSGDFCAAVNKANGFTSNPSDTGTCIYAGDSLRFNNISTPTTYASGGAINSNMTASRQPVTEGCAVCAGGNHFFHLLHAR